MIPACQAYPFASSSLVYSGRGLWFGYSVKNVHATDTALITFRDGIGTGAKEIGFAECLAGRSENAFPSGASVGTEQGLFVQIAGGTATVVPYYLTLTRLIAGLALYDNADTNLSGTGLLHYIEWMTDHGFDLPTLTDVSPG